MIRLLDSVQIRTTPEQIFRWLEAMPLEYRSWHPDHVACRVLKGPIFQVGSEIQCEEVLHGKLHTMRLRPTGIEGGKRLEYEIVGLGKGSFQVISQGEAVEFTAENSLGSDVAVLGALLGAVLRFFFRRRLEAMRQHMREEGQNLKKILEAGWEPTDNLEEFK